MESYQIPYGDGALTLVIHPGNVKAVLEPHGASEALQISEREIVRRALEHPIGQIRLRELAKGKQRITLITSDHTRPVPSKLTLPILLSRILPALAGQFASIIKDSSLLSVIAVIELTQTIQEISADNFRMFENYIFVGLLYFILTFSVSMISGVFERRYNHEYRTNKYL